jgi:integrase/recombinase XerD
MNFISAANVASICDGPTAANNKGNQRRLAAGLLPRSYGERWSRSSQARIKNQILLSSAIERVPKLVPIIIDASPTLPLSRSQYGRILEVVALEFDEVKGKRVHALIQLMRYSGLSIADAVRLKRKELVFDEHIGTYRITTKRLKTDVHVSVPIPADVAAEVLAAMELNKSPHYIFWNTGTGKLQSAVTNWQHDLRKVFRTAGLPDGHPHQLRDTFAVWLLENGMPMEEVSRALGHDSIRTTEKYYAKWNKQRQARLDTFVMKAWMPRTAIT